MREVHEDPGFRIKLTNEVEIVPGPYTVTVRSSVSDTAVRLSHEAWAALTRAFQIPTDLELPKLLSAQREWAGATRAGRRPLVLARQAGVELPTTLRRTPASALVGQREQRGSAAL